MTWDELDWEVLDRLRETFLTAAKTEGPYWHTITDLECYDFTYGERIGWKWDAVLGELRRRQWRPAATGLVLDWGCGSGAAGRRVVDHLGSAQIGRLVVHDHSPLAMDYAVHRAGRKFAGLAVERADLRLLRGEAPIDVLVVSHVLNELDEIGRADLAALCARAGAILWVEPGSRDVSRALGGWRDRLLREGWHAVSPCTHQAACGVLAPGNEAHWCHQFAAPPASLYADSNWVKFGQRAGIDLRSLPYSYLVLDRQPMRSAEGFSRILGVPETFKGYARFYNCDADGVAQLTLQKRDDPELFKTMKRGTHGHVYRWEKSGDRVRTAASGGENSVP